jgi:hypothetical protein
MKTIWKNNGGMGAFQSTKRLTQNHLNYDLTFRKGKTMVFCGIVRATIKSLTWVPMVIGEWVHAVGSDLFDSFSSTERFVLTTMAHI